MRRGCAAEGPGRSGTQKGSIHRRNAAVGEGDGFLLLACPRVELYDNGCKHLARATQQRVRRRLKVQEATCDTIRAINQLAGFDTPEVESVSDLRGPSAELYSDVRALHSAHAPAPGNSFTPQEAFNELLGSTPSSYIDGDETSPVRPYSRELVSWPQEGNRPAPLPTNAPPDVLQRTSEGQRDAWTRQPLEAAQVRQGEGPPTLNGDTILKNDRDAYVGFVQGGLARGSFRFGRRRVVKMEGGSIRIVIDCRRSNRHFRAAPKARPLSGRQQLCPRRDRRRDAHGDAGRRAEGSSGPGAGVGEAVLEAAAGAGVDPSPAAASD